MGNHKFYDFQITQLKLLLRYWNSNDNSLKRKKKFDLWKGADNDNGDRKSEKMFLDNQTP